MQTVVTSPQGYYSMAAQSALAMRLASACKVTTQLRSSITLALNFSHLGNDVQAMCTFRAGD